eukprot:m51a1_g2614 putative type ii inositol -trisphosphate 5-phosphatase-like (1072) ;mRNA; r:512229-517451
MDELSRVQKILRKEEICYFAAGAKEVKNGRKIPILISLVATINKTPEEVAVFTLGNKFDTWHIRDILPVYGNLAYRISPDNPLHFELHYEQPRPGSGGPAPAQQPAAGMEPHTFEAGSASTLRFFLAAIAKANCTARDEGFAASGPSHQWIKYYRMRAARRHTPASERSRTKLNLGQGASDTNITWISKMLKTRESEFTQHKTMTVFCGTWNVNGQKPGVALESWLVCKDVKPDIYCVGFQELDLSASALVLGDTSQGAPWELAINSTLKSIGDYVLLIMKQLVGMLLCVYIKREHLSKIGDVQSNLTAVGIMGMMGNKGGVAVRFDICDSTFCIVNSHLNAHGDNIMRRNQDYHDICHRILFFDDESGTYYTVYDHDFLFWVGDLNYRVDGDDADIRQKIQQRDFTSLLANDQLKQQIKKGLAFEGFCEAPIRFAPTYKYDKDSTSYDTSERSRTPAWCDRILWRSSDAEAVGNISYSRHEILSSDHRPVSAIFLIKVKSIIPEARSKVYQELLKQLDMMENECMPDAHISTNTVSFGDTYYNVPQTRTVTLENTGQVMARWRFIPKLDESKVHKPWLMVCPTSGILLPGENCQIRITVSIDNKTAPDLNMEQDKLEDILILHLENGKDNYISVSGHYMKSCFGMSLEKLVVFPLPVRHSKPLAEGSEDRLTIPKELWRIVDWLYRRGMEAPDIFCTSGSSDMELIRECLDTGDSFCNHDINIHSVAETLIQFLESLSEPVIPVEVYAQCLDASQSYTQCRATLAHALKPVHYAVFHYLISFLREMLTCSDKNKLTPERLAVLFSSVLLRPTERGAQQTDRRKVDFLFHFLGQFVVTQAQIAMGASQIEFSFHFGGGNPGRRVTMNSSPMVSKRFQSVFSLITDTYAFSLQSVDCQTGCTLYFSLKAECPLEVCVHSVTSNFWARLQDSNGANIYGPSKAHPIELSADLHSPDITIKKGARNFYTFTPSVAATMPVEWFVGAFSNIAVGGSTSTWNDPQNTTAGGFIQLHNREKRAFTANQKTYYVVELADTFVGDDATYHVCIGSNCNSGAVAVAVSTASLFSALSLFL